MMKIVSVRENPDLCGAAVDYISGKWGAPRILYEDCISHCVSAPGPLPQWYLLMKETEITGCAGLITNDFISRMDLYPWLCALFIEEGYRGHAYGRMLIGKAKRDALDAGFKHLYLSTEHIGYYEKYGFRYIGNGYHPWNAVSRIYETGL